MILEFWIRLENGETHYRRGNWPFYVARQAIVAEFGAMNIVKVEGQDTVDRQRADVTPSFRAYARTLDLPEKMGLNA